MGMDVTGKSGNYFRANCWSWRPIHALIEEINQELNCGWDLELFGSNDGAGLQTQEDCNRLADEIEKRLNAGIKKLVLHLSDSPCLVDKNTGQFVDPGEIKRGQQVESAWSTDAEHLREFVTFLRECGGSFEIW
jgi:hypothetical protein